MNDTYIPPKLTKYGKIENIIQAGSVALQSGDLTDDGQDDTAFDTNGDGKADVVVGAAGGNTPVTFLFNSTSTSYAVSADFYDSDGDGQADFAIADLNNSPALQRIDLNQPGYISLSNIYNFYSEQVGSDVGTTETSSNGGWDDPARD